MDLSVCIVNWNTDTLLTQCVQSLVENTHAIEYEIVIVDNGSSDESFIQVKDKFSPNKRVKLIALRENVGFSAGNNIAISYAQGRYVVLLNPDTVVTNGALDAATAFMDSCPDCGAMGPRLLNPDGTLQPSVGNFPTLWGIFWESTRLRKIFPRTKLFSAFKRFDLDYGRLQEVDQPSGACLFLRRSVLEQVGLFDERFFMYYEEVDLCQRIKMSGWRIVFNPDVNVIHFGGASSQKNPDVRIVQNARSKLRYFAKHSRPGVQKRISLLFLRGIMIFESAIRALGTWAFYSLNKGGTQGAHTRIEKHKEVIRLCITPNELFDSQ